VFSEASMARSSREEAGVAKTGRALVDASTAFGMTSLVNFR
jgi:hypothetical protein